MKPRRSSKPRILSYRDVCDESLEDVLNGFRSMRSSDAHLERTAKRYQGTGLGRDCLKEIERRKALDTEVASP